MGNQRSEFNEQMSVIAQSSPALIRQARQAQILTVAWMVVEGVVAVGAGVVARSVALTAFGFDSAYDARAFGDWVIEHFSEIKQQAESSTRIGSLRNIEQYSASKYRFLRFNFESGPTPLPSAHARLATYQELINPP